MTQTTDSAATEPAAAAAEAVEATEGDPSVRKGGHRIHRAWFVAAVTFVTITGAAAFRSLPGLLIDPLHQDFGWSRGTIGAAVSINLALYGLTAPFAAALMDRFGIRRVV
ncbi:MFS transporter, partial [Streptomyces carpinensis]